MPNNTEITVPTVLGCYGHLSVADLDSPDFFLDDDSLFDPDYIFFGIARALGLDPDLLLETDANNGYYATANFHEFIHSILRATLVARDHIAAA